VSGLDFSMFDPDTLRDAAAELRERARSYHDHPDTAPALWLECAPSIPAVRARADRLALLALYLEIQAVKGGDL